MQKEQFYKLFQNHQLLNNETLAELKELVENYPFFQAGVLLYLKNLKIEKALEFDDVLKKYAVHISDRKMLYRFLHSNNTDIKQLAESSLKPQNYFKLNDEPETEPQNSLIDRFLTSGTGAFMRKINPGAEMEPGLDDDIVTSSLSENDEIITETLAMLYYQQKKYDKALDAFKKLSLKYPEKSVYFATRIEEIEKLKNI